ncbi:hypothetical protein ACFQ07_26415, partial [Actinomadura adrarensis]
SGTQVIIIKTDGRTFPNGDAWRCLTCGFPEGNAIGRTGEFDHPETSWDGRRLLAGQNIIECSGYTFTDTRCTPTGSTSTRCGGTSPPPGPAPAEACARYACIPTACTSGSAASPPPVAARSA